MEKGMEEYSNKKFGELIVPLIHDFPKKILEEEGCCCRKAAELKRNKKDCLIMVFGNYFVVCDFNKTSKTKAKNAVAEKNHSVSTPLGKAQDALNKQWKLVHYAELEKLKLGGLNDES